MIEEERSSSTSLGRILAWVLVIGLLVIVALQLMSSQEDVLAIGETAPPFTLNTFDGEKINSSDLVGKVVLINFWASWCKPCEQEAADLQTAWELYEDRGDVVFLGVDYVDTEREALAYLDKFNITYPNGPDLGTRISQAFRIRGVPESFFLNKAGEAVFVQIGPFTDLDDITDQIEKLLDS